MGNSPILSLQSDIIFLLVERNNIFCIEAYGQGFVHYWRRS